MITTQQVTLDITYDDETMIDDTHRIASPENWNFTGLLSINDQDIKIIAEVAEPARVRTLEQVRALAKFMSEPAEQDEDPVWVDGYAKAMADIVLWIDTPEVMIVQLPLIEEEN